MALGTISMTHGTISRCLTKALRVPNQDVCRLHKDCVAWLAPLAHPKVTLKSGLGVPRC